MKTLNKISTYLIVAHIILAAIILTRTTYAASSVEIWWPTNGATVSGVQPFKAMLPGWSVNDYQMFWQVDGGGLNRMESNYQDYPHKESSVDLSGWSWHGQGPYSVNFVAQDWNGNRLTESSVKIYVSSQPSSTSLVKVVSTPLPSDNPFSSAKLYVDSNSEPKRLADSWRSWNSYNASLMDKIANSPESRWFGGWNWNIYSDVNNHVTTAANQGAVPVLVLYNIPGRDCGGYSAGGTSVDGYRSWIRSVAQAIGSKKAVVVLEPDAIASMDCLSWNDRETRLSLLREAVQTLNNQGNVSVYIDSGHAYWLNSDEAASRLKKAGIDQARGFSLNVSNFISTQENINYGQKVSSLTGGKKFVIDTSRNGNGSNGQWCNPWGRALGSKPTSNTGNSLIDAFLWIKKPGESDGWCNGGPSAGTFWADYALDLAKNSSW